MIHKGDHLIREAERLERQADGELDKKRRDDLRRLAADKRQKERDWYRPR